VNEQEAKEKIAKAMWREKKSLRHIARALGMGRKRLRRLLGLSPSKPPDGKKKPSKLDPFRERVRELAERTDRVGGKELRMTVKAIFRTIRKEGYGGGLTILGDYVREIRKTGQSRKAFARYEPAPAYEAQMDWSPYRIGLGDRDVKIHVFSLILSHSRYQYLEAFLDERQDTLLFGHVEAFKYILGVPAVILYDNQKPVVACRISGRPLLHERFASFAEHYGFRPKICLPYDKERKGRVERPFGYLESDFFPGRSFASLFDLRAQLRAWLEGEEEETGNFRIHGTTRKRPVDLWAEERPLLIELPETDFMPTRVEERIVAKDCTVSVLGNRYTVPPKHVGKTVTVMITPAAVEAYDKKRNRIAVHAVPEGKGRLVVDEAHYAQLRRAKKHMPASACESLFHALFPGEEAFLEGLKKRVKSVYPIHLKHLQKLAERYTAAQVAAAVREAVSHSIFTSTYVEECLKRRHPSQLSLRLFDEDMEKPKGLMLGRLELGDASLFDTIFAQGEEEPEKEENHGSDEL
jgi:transposase